jgi:hypothetical protein
MQYYALLCLRRVKLLNSIVLFKDLLKFKSKTLTNYSIYNIKLIGKDGLIGFFKDSKLR